VIVIFTDDMTQPVFNIESLFYLTNTAVTSRRHVCRIVAPRKDNLQMQRSSSEKRGNVGQIK